MHMKRIISVFVMWLCLIHVFLFQVSAAGSTHDLSVTTEFDAQTQASMTNCVYAGSSINMDSGSVTYRVSAPADGVYKLTFYGTGFDNATYMSVDVNQFELYADVSMENPNAPGSGVPLWKTIHVGNITLVKGINTITFNAEGNIYLRKVFLMRERDTEFEDIFTISTSNTERVSITGDSDGSSTGGMEVGAAVWFTFDAPEAGLYSLKARAATATDGTYFEVNLNSFSLSLADNISIQNKGWNVYAETAPVMMELPAGESTVILVNKGGINQLSDIRIDPIVSAAQGNELVQKIKTAASVREVKNAFHQNVYFKKGAEALFYPDSLYIRLMQEDSITDVKELTAAWNQALQAVSEAPDVTLVNEGSYVNKPMTGLNKLRLSSKLLPNVRVIAAVYRENRLVDMVSAVTADNDREISFHNELTTNDAVCKVFFWNDLEHMSPLDFSEVYASGQHRLFVAPYGDDSFSGTVEKPLKTIQKAKEKVKTLNKNMEGNIIVNILPGEYYIDEKLTFTNEDSGTNGYSVIYRGAGEEKPLISGGVKVGSGWTDTNGDGIYEISVPNVTEARQMYVNGFARERAKSDVLYTADSKRYSKGGLYDEDGFTCKGYSFPKFSHPEDLEVVTHILWAMQRLPVAKVLYDRVNDETTFEMKQPHYDSYISMICEGGIQPVVGSRFYLENALEFLDEEGEFYFDKRTKILYYKPHNGENLANAEIYLPKSEGLLSLVGTGTNKVSNIKFENLDFRHGAFNSASGKGVVTFQSDCLARYNSHAQNPASAGSSMFSQIYMENAEHIDITGCNFSELGSAAIGMIDNVSDCSVERNTIHDISATSIIIGNWRYSGSTDPNTLCNNITVKDNLIARTGQEFMGSSAVGVYYANHVDILHNELKDVPYTGITLGWGWGSSVPVTLNCGHHKVIGNKIESNSREEKDGGAIYTLGYLNNTIIAENYLIDSPDFGSIYLDSGSASVTVQNNVIKNTNSWLFTDKRDNVTVKDNYVDKDNYSFEENTTSGKESTMTGTVVYENGNWTGKALQYAEAAGLSDEAEGKITIADRPSYLGTVYDYVPREEACREGDYILENDTYTSTNVSNVLIYTQGNGRNVTANFQQGHWYQFEVSVKEAGLYSADLRCTTGPANTDTGAKVSIMVNSSYQLRNKMIQPTVTPWCSYPSATVGTVKLKKGVNTIRLLNVQGGFAFDNLKLIRNAASITSDGIENYIPYKKAYLNGVDDVGYAANMIPSGTVTFEFDVPEAGYYSVSAIGVSFKLEAALIPSVNGSEQATASMGNTLNAQQTTQPVLGSFYLTRGKNEISLRSIENVYLNAVLVKKQ